jgi:Zn-dependent membrane protease YugP
MLFHGIHPYGFDLLYWLIILVSVVLSGGAALLVKLQFSRGKSIAIASGLTGCEVAARILRDADITDVNIEEYPGMLSDHYSPMTKTLSLSPEVYRGRTAAAAGVAAHEVGHAIQHARGYAPLWLRSVLMPMASIGSMLGPIIIFVGIALDAAAQAASGHHDWGYFLAVTGVCFFGAAAAFSVITLPVEFNASGRARERLTALGITRPGDEDNAVRGVLTAAGLTYVAAAVSAILWLLYYAWRAGLLGGRRN